jgi:hypothetical protein
MKKFDSLMDMFLTEFNVQDRNDPSFYDYVVVMLQQFISRDLLHPETLRDLRDTATEIVKDGYYIYKDFDTNHNIAYKIAFIFDNTEKDLTGMQVRIYDLINQDKEPHVIDNTFEDSSISDIGDYIEQVKGEHNEEEVPGETAPEAVGETPSALPGAVPPAEGEAPPAGEGNTPAPPAAGNTPNTSQYLQGLK